MKIRYEEQFKKNELYNRKTFSIKTIYYKKKTILVYSIILFFACIMVNLTNQLESNGKCDEKSGNGY